MAKRLRGIAKNKVDEICQNIESQFMSRETAALLIGLENIDQLIGIESELSLKQAETRRDNELVQRILKGDTNARWLLTRLNPQTYGYEVPKKEKSGYTKPKYEIEVDDSDYDNIGELPWVGFDDDEEDSEVKEKVKRKIRRRLFQE